MRPLALRCGVRGVVLASLLATSGCQLVFKLEDIPAVPDGPPPPAACTLPGTRLCLTFDDDLADNDTPDLSGNGNDAELVAVLATARGDQQAIALEVGSRITVKDINTLNFPGPLSFDAFFRWRGVFGTGEFGQAVIDNSNQWGSTINNLLGYGCTFLFDDRPDTLVTSNSLQIGVWHHLACVYDPAQGVILYFDGVEKARDDRVIGGTVRTTASGGGRIHAGSFDSDTAKLTGDLDNVRVFDRVLSPTEILDTVNND